MSELEDDVKTIMKNGVQNVKKVDEIQKHDLEEIEDKFIDVASLMSDNAETRQNLIRIWVFMYQLGHGLESERMVQLSSEKIDKLSG